MKKIKYRAISPDGFDVERDTIYKTIAEAEVAIQKFVKKYTHQGYYSTVKQGQRILINLEEIADNCSIINIV